MRRAARRLLQVIGSDTLLVLAAIVFLGALALTGFYLVGQRVDKLERPAEGEIIKRQTIALRACRRGEASARSRPREQQREADAAARRCRRELLRLLRDTAIDVRAEQRRARKRRTSSRRRGATSSAGAPSSERGQVSPSAPSLRPSPPVARRPARRPTPARPRPSRPGGSTSPPPDTTQPSSPPPGPPPRRPPVDLQLPPGIPLPGVTVCLQGVGGVGCPRL